MGAATESALRSRSIRMHNAMNQPNVVCNDKTAASKVLARSINCCRLAVHCHGKCQPRQAPKQTDPHATQAQSTKMVLPGHRTINRRQRGRRRLNRAYAPPANARTYDYTHLSKNAATIQHTNHKLMKYRF